MKRTLPKHHVVFERAAETGNIRVILMERDDDHEDCKCVLDIMETTADNPWVAGNWFLHVFEDEDPTIQVVGVENVDYGRCRSLGGRLRKAAMVAATHQQVIEETPQEEKPRVHIVILTYNYGASRENLAVFSSEVDARKFVETVREKHKENNAYDYAVDVEVMELR